MTLIALALTAQRTPGRSYSHWPTIRPTSSWTVRPQWVRQRATEPEPFLLVYSCREPHPPFGAPDPFHGRHRPADMPLSPTRRDPAGAQWAAQAQRSVPAAQRLHAD